MHAVGMSVAELRSGLTELVELLPVDEVSAIRASMEAALTEMLEAWRGSGHPAAEAAPSALRAALAELETAAAGLGEFRGAIESYLRGL